MGKVYENLNMIELIERCRNKELKLCNVCGKILNKGEFSSRSDSGTCKKCAVDRDRFYVNLKKKTNEIKSLEIELLKTKIADCEKRIEINNISATFARMIGDWEREAKVLAIMGRNHELLAEMKEELGASNK